MLMDEVGCAVSSEEEESLLKAVRALAELHQTGYRRGSAQMGHRRGSARIDNLLACGDRFKWCGVQLAGVDADVIASKQGPVVDDLRSLLSSYGVCHAVIGPGGLRRQPDHGGLSGSEFSCRGSGKRS